MSGTAYNTYTPQNSWIPEGVNMNITAQPVNLPPNYPPNHPTHYFQPPSYTGGNPTFQPTFEPANQSREWTSNGGQHPSNYVNFNNAFPPPSTFNVPPPSTHFLPPPFHLPPYPPPFHLQSIPPVDASSKCQVSLEETSLASFLEQFKIGKCDKPKSGITIAAFRSSLKGALLMLEMLRSRRGALVSLLHSPQEEWETQVKEVAQLQMACGVLTELCGSSSIGRKLERVRRRRELKVKLKQQALGLKVKREGARGALSQKIDKCLEAIKEKNLNQKREVEMKREADEISAEVRRKIQEGRRAVERLRLLERLRAARQLNAEQKGLSGGGEGASFCGRVSRLRSLVHSRLGGYALEKEGLCRVEEGERRGEGRERILRSLFGAQDDSWHKSSNTRDLVQIRREWDAHVSQEGESIPLQWVAPPPTGGGGDDD